MVFRPTGALAVRASRVLLGGGHGHGGHGHGHGDGHGGSDGGRPNKFANHIYLDASGQPWFDLHKWELGRKPDGEDLNHPGRHASFSQTQRLVSITFVDRDGNPHRIKCEPGQNLAEAALEANVDLDWADNATEGCSTFSHMVVSSPHFEMLVPPDYREDKYLWDLEMWGTSHRNSRVIKFLFVKPWMEGMVVTHPLCADVVTPNFTDPFTGKIEDKDQAVAPTYFVSKVVDRTRPDYRFPSVLELLWAGVDTYEQLWDHTRQSWLRRLDKRQQQNQKREEDEGKGSSA